MVRIRLALILLIPSAASAQPADLPIPAATAHSFPAGISVRATEGGRVYADRKGRTLYGLDMRTVQRWSPDPALHCDPACLKLWEPVLAPEDIAINIRYPGAPGRSRPDKGGDPKEADYLDNRKAPDWTVIRGPRGPQWVYKGWHMVFVRRGDRPGATTHEGADGRVWNTLKYVPPMPKLTAPPGVQALFAGGRYVMADAVGHALFTGDCANACSGWRPMPAGLVSRGIGDWTVRADGDTPQWQRGNALVYIDNDGDPATLPEGGKPVLP